MVDKNTNFFEIVDNFAKTKDIKSICIFKSDIDFVPKVTIAIPTFKRVDLLKEAIESALNQIDYTNYDVIVVDNNPERDCETEQLLDTYKNSKISYYKNSKNIGMAGNWNRLFTLAQGEYVVMLHDDDMLMPKFLTESNLVLEQNIDIGILKPKNFKVYNQKGNLQIDEIPVLNGDLKRLYDISFYYGQVIGVPSGMFYKKEYVKKMGGFNQDFFPTLDFCFMVLFSKHYEVYTLNKYLSLYRIIENESLKITTLNGFLKNDFYLIYQLLKGHNIPSRVIINFLRHRTYNMAAQNKKILNENFNFDMASLNLTKINPILGKIYHFIVRVSSFILKENKR